MSTAPSLRLVSRPEPLWREVVGARLRHLRRRRALTLVEAARQEAARLVSDAKATAERIRTDSERELAAASQRRDSINAQLSNVRQMLATLTGTAAMPLTAFGADEDDQEHAAPADGPADTDLADADDDVHSAQPDDGSEAEQTRDAHLAQS